MKVFLLFLGVTILFLIDFYVLKATKHIFSFSIYKSILFNIIYWLPFAIILITSIYGIYILKETYRTLYFSVLFTSIVLLYIPKINIVIFYSIEYVISLFFNNYTIITKIGMALSLLTFLFVLHGITVNKDNFRVRTKEVYFENLPDSFDGFKIVQVSDIHIGSYGKSTKSVDKAVKLINTENPDLILFTGDLVNNIAEEVNGFEQSFNKLNSKYGKYSILGNHDYGDYYKWKNNKQKQQNLNNLIAKHKDIGFNILLNANIKIGIQTDSILLAGVENWGKPPFPQLGDIDKALYGNTKDYFTILMSHDPSHWRAKIIDKTNIALTLSGHTHAMQAGIEIGSFQWSPVSIKYKEWGGLYSENNQYLYVNRGLGYLGLLGRIGIRPEITVIVLHKK